MKILNYLLIGFMLFAIILSCGVVLGYNETLYDDCSIDLISTNFYNGIYFPFNFTGNFYGNNYITVNGDEHYAMARINYYDRQIIGVKTNITHGNTNLGSGICIGDGIIGLYQNSGNVIAFYNGWCLNYQNWFEKIINGTETLLFTLSDLGGLLPNDYSEYILTFYIKDGYIIYKLNDTLIFNYSINYSDSYYIPDINTTYLFYGRNFYPAAFDNINVRNIYDISEEYTINNNITSCGSYILHNNYYEMNIPTVGMTNPCLILNITNSTMRCLNNITGTNIETFANITYMNNSIIENCNFRNFNSVFNMTNINGNNNKFRNMNISNIKNNFIYAYITSPKILNNTEIYNINGNNFTADFMMRFSVNGIDNLNMHDIYLTNSFYGILAFNIKNLIISNYVHINGTAYSLYLYNVNNPIIQHSTFINTGYYSIWLKNVKNINFYYNINNLNILNILRFYSEVSSINPLSSYNLGWFPNNYLNENISNINFTSLYNISNSYDVINSSLVKNNTKYYFIFPICPQNWERDVMPCVDGVKLISYYDVNNCNSYTNLPSNNSTNEYCEILIKFDSISIIDTITELDIIILIILALLIYFPFFMNDKRWFALYIVVGMLLFFYSNYMYSKFVLLYPENTFLSYFLRLFLYIASGLMVLFGLYNAFKLFIDLIFGKKT